MDNDDDDGKPADLVPARPRPRVVGYGFSCGTGPCKVFSIIENEPTPPKLPAPVEPEPDER